jgi:hypothetical protein
VRLAVSTSGDYEAEANRLRAEIGSTIEELRYDLRPSNLASEAASRVGNADLSWGGVFDFASKHHAVPTAIIGLGLALWTLSAIRRRATTGGVAGLTSPLNETSASLVDSATKVLRDRAETKRQQFVSVAQAQVATEAERLADEVERKLENVIGQVPGGAEVRPLIESVVQIGLSAALESLFRKDDSGWKSRVRS